MKKKKSEKLSLWPNEVLVYLERRGLPQINCYVVTAEQRNSSQNQGRFQRGEGT